MVETSLGFLKYLLTAFILYGVFIVAERIRPAEVHQPLKGIIFNLKWYVLYSVVGLAFSFFGMNLLIEQLQRSTGMPLFVVSAPEHGWQYCGWALLHFMVVDFFYYWFHRTQHQVGFFWEQHKFHHSETAMNVTSTRRVHWLEDPLIILFVGLPIGLLFRVEGLEMGILSFIEVLWLQFIHMNLRLELGILSLAIVGPQQHRLHHSFLPQHIDRNFGVFFSLWDILFGTYHRPQKNEFPATGLASGETYDTLWSGSIAPLQAWFSVNYLGKFLRQFR